MYACKYPVECIEGCVGCLQGRFCFGQVLLGLTLLLGHFGLDRCHLKKKEKPNQTDEKWAKLLLSNIKTHSPHRVFKNEASPFAPQRLPQPSPG